MLLWKGRLRSEAGRSRRSRSFAKRRVPGIPGRGAAEQAGEGTRLIHELLRLRREHHAGRDGSRQGESKSGSP